MMLFYRKKQLSLVGLILFLSLWFFPASGVEAKTKTYGDFTYERREATNGESGFYIGLISYNGTEENVVIPETIDSLEVWTLPSRYQYPDKIKTVTISKNVWYSVSDAFRDLNHLEKIKVVPENKEYMATEDGILYNKKGTELIAYPKGKKDTTFVMSDRVRGTEETVFDNNRYLKKIVWGKNCKVITGMTGSNVETVVMRRNTEHIDPHCFHGCKNLKQVVWGENVRTIGEYAFSDCTSLFKVSLPNSLQIIDEGAFAHCKSLGTVKIPKSVHRLARNAFLESGAKVILHDYLVKDGRNYIGKANIASNSTKKQYKVKNITKIRPEKSSMTIKKGKKYKLDTKISIKGEKKGILKDRRLAYYVSSDPKVVKVSSYGNITGVKKGRAVITVKLNGVSCRVKVKVK